MNDAIDATARTAAGRPRRRGPVECDRCGRAERRVVSSVMEVEIRRRDRSHRGAGTEGSLVADAVPGASMGPSCRSPSCPPPRPRREGRTMATATTGSAAIEARDLPGPPVSHRRASCAGSFRDPQPVLDELAATYGRSSASGSGRSAWPSSATRRCSRELFAMPTRLVPLGPQVQRARVRGRAGLDDRVRRSRPQAPPVARCRRRSAAGGSTAGSR